MIEIEEAGFGMAIDSRWGAATGTFDDVPSIAMEGSRWCPLNVSCLRDEMRLDCMRRQKVN